MTRKGRSVHVWLAVLGAISFSQAASAAGEAKRGAQVFRACMACHSTSPDEHLTGPSLANVFNRKAGTVDGFTRYSDAMSHAQIGLRYILPIFPFLCLAGGFAVGEVKRLSPGFALALAGPLLLWHAHAAFSIHPYHLAYFNEAAGGPDNGYRRLVDSNLDWGQDLGGLKRFMSEHAIPSIHLFYFGTADPAYYGIKRASPGEPGWFAVSATHLMGVYLPDPGYLGPFREMAPIATIGHSIFVYRLDTFPSFLNSPIRRN